MDDLRDAELEWLARQLPHAIVKVDADGKIRWCSSLAAVWVDQLGMLAEDLVEPEYRGRLRAALASALGSSRTSDIGVFMRLRGEEPRPVAIHLLPNTAPDAQPSTFLAFAAPPAFALDAQWDVVERMTHLGHVAGAIALEFNNALQGVLSHLTLAQEALGRGGDPHRDLEETEVATHRAIELASELQTFDGRRPLDRKPIRLGALLESAVSLARRLLPPGVALQHEGRTPHVWVLADRPRLQQVILNLCMNARDALPSGGSVTLQATLEQERVVIRVRDNGRGMSSEVRERALEPFFTTKEPGRGTGLGLSIAYGIVEQHEGSIQIESALGQGTVVTLRLPELRDPGEPAPPARVVNIGAAGKTVLVADDEPQVRRLLTRVLVHHGYEVVGASTGAEVLRILRDRTRKVDLALLDAVMPHPSGEELYKRVHALRPRLPVLFCSGYAAAALSAEFLQANEIEVLSKPFHPAELTSAVARHLAMPLR